MTYMSHFQGIIIEYGIPYHCKLYKEKRLFITRSSLYVEESSMRSYLFLHTTEEIHTFILALAESS